jgi:hypothetical protein
MIRYVKKGYASLRPLPEPFDLRMNLYTLRNMLWKAMVRHYMGYFEETGSFYMLNADNRASLRDFTLGRIAAALAAVS